jgi:hypothetical protein
MRILLLIAVLLPAFVSAQSVEVKIEVVENPSSTVRVSGRVPSQGVRNLSFIRTVSGFGSLDERISALVVKDKAGKAIEYQAPIPSEFVAEADIHEFSYILDLTPRKEANAAAHVSWLAKDTGVLMLGDMLPRVGSLEKMSVDLTVAVPQGWTTDVPTERKAIIDVGDSVFFVGKGSQRRTLDLGYSRINLFKGGEWQFTDKDLDDALTEILREYKRVLGTVPEEFTVATLKFPNSTPTGQWQAETRGRNITIVSSDMAFRTQSVQRLHEQLRHEIFHLWIPKGLNLSGNYDWFYEGFALYQSLKTAVALNRIRFEDFLDTLSRAQSIDARQTNRISLIEASNKRWSGANTYVYARGMVTAFLMDLTLLNSSKGKRSVTNLLGEVFAKHRYPNTRMDGNAAVQNIFKGHSELAPLVQKYIEGSGKFEWDTEIALAGLESKNGLSVVTKPNGRQKDLLDRLGYNNWQRLSPTK